MRQTTEDTMNVLAPQQYCLRWKYHHSNLQAMFSQLLERESYCDVTLACEGKTLRAHKVMLSACSTYFDTILSQHDENKAIVILKDVKFSDIQALVSFMYKGEINVENTELSSLLKTAEELKIKGLAEVSWRSDEEQQSHTYTATANEPSISKKRKLESLHTTTNIKKEFSDKPKVNFDDMDTADADDGSEPDQSIWEPEMQQVVDSENVGVSKKTTLTSNVTSYTSEEDRGNSTTTISQGFSEQPAHVPDLSQFSDVMKMNDYLESGGRRPQFWEEPFTKRLMEAIKNKELEMKVAAELMGVSYGTLYGRYRDAYGCLKHPYRVRDFWLEQGPADVLAKLQRKELTLFRAAEILNVTVTTLANYLSTMRQGDNPLTVANTTSNATDRSTLSVEGMMSESDREQDSDDDEDNKEEANILMTSTSNAQSQQNIPDITVVRTPSTMSKINNLNGN
ncbi:zinc finger and BTB domain-containing protein 14-like [Adelges cooleyi]|uniref:zinc finger and BTB domain-containing protein 14-like n=1 Tax=Adelges cooleyi TaxID=133065 RepID=UPI00217F7C16|nr:zinc finger and BTB domain-containing protein 14-like [Adelges cooleyi]XP_050438226.1 zinc finger and BTB domain-containing protein 14-like [Adelges cooleyi]